MKTNRQCPKCTYPLKVVVDTASNIRITCCTNCRCGYQRIRKYKAR